MAASTGTLGCPQTYSVEVIYTPRNDETLLEFWRQPRLPNVTKVEYGRVLNQTSQATITVATDQLSRACCEQLAALDYWVFEARIWRDGLAVWEGPMTAFRHTTQGDPLTITANDVTDWFNGPYGILNTRNINYTSKELVTDLAVEIIRAQLDVLTPPDHPKITGYLDTLPGGRRISYRRGVVHEYLADTIADLQQYGLDWTTVGRQVIYMPPATSQNRPPIARLTDGDITDSVSLVRDGHQLGTVGWGSKTNTSGTVTRVSYGSTRSYYGRHDRVNDVQDQDADTGDLREAARAALAGRTGPQVTLTLPGTATLRPTAPITMEQLVPGQVVRMGVLGLCEQVQALLMIADVSVTWVPGLEEVKVGLTQLGDVEEFPEVI
jgi:hypothetical protein